MSHGWKSIYFQGITTPCVEESLGGIVLDITRFVTRSWYYFRMGYSTYLTFLLGYLSTLVTVYYLAIKDMPMLLKIFPHFLTFVIFGTIVGVPLSVLIGWLHLKRTSAWTAEVDIGVEANPYNYKLPPGYWTEVFAPTFLELLKQNRKILASNNLLSPEDSRKIVELEEKLSTLVSGGYVGRPRRRWRQDSLAK
jgi:hypothetical protein